MDHFGLSVALLSPLDAGGALDTARLAAHASAMMDRGADGVTVFGTTGEGASFGASERAAGIRCLVTAGIPAERIVVGLCGTSVEDVAVQVRQARDVGVTTFLLPPPFYFPAPDPEGLHDWHAGLLAATDAAARFVLYHIPQVTGVPVPPALVSRLAAGFGDRVRAVKDSSGDWANTRTLLDAGDVPVLVGDERLLHKALALGAAGSICGMANLYPERMRRILDTRSEDAALSAEVGHIVSGPVTPGLKALMAEFGADPAWRAVRPPLVPLDDAESAALVQACAAARADA